jgi:hypothetical protein
MALAGGAAFLFALGVAISAGTTEGLSPFGRFLLFGGAVMAAVGVVFMRIAIRTPDDLPETDEDASSLAVYAMGRRSLLAMNFWAPLLALIGLVIGPAFLVFGLQGLVEGPGFGDRVGGLVLAAFGLGGIGLALWMGQASIQSFKLRHHQDPYFRLDEQAIECARGRFLWRDIDRVVEVIDKRGEGSDSIATRLFIFVLHEGATPQRVERAYLDGMDRELIGEASLTPYGLELTIDHCRKEAHQALANYHHAPVKAEREKLSTNEAATSSTP